jgi:hypothetical protein
MPAASSYAVASRAGGDYVLGVTAAGAVKRFLEFPAQDNLIVNGGMRIDQQFVGALTTPGAAAYVCDGWITQDAGGGTIQAQQVSDAPPGFAKSLKVTVTVADASVTAGEFYIIQQNIEGLRVAHANFGTANAKSLGLGFWVKAHRTGTYSVALQNAGNARAYVMEYTVSAADTWEYKTFVIPGDTTGTWLTTAAAAWKLFFHIAIDTASYGTATIGSWITAVGGITGSSNQINGVAATTDTFQISGVSLFVGGVAAPDTWSSAVQRGHAEDLELCQRYYEKSFEQALAPATNLTDSTGIFVFTATKAGAVGQDSPTAFFKVKKRLGSGVTVTLYNQSAANNVVRDLTAGADTSTNTVIAIGETGFAINFTGAAGGAVGDRMLVHWTADCRI